MSLHIEGNDPQRAQSLLTTRNLKKIYKKRTVVQDVSLEVRSGEVVGLLGPNGAGKTTCFYMVVGLVACDGGDVFIDETKITHLPIHRRARLGVSYLPQEASVFRKLTVIENIQAVLELQNLTPAVMESRAEELLEELHIGHIRNSSAASLSGGERRRVEIARALSTDPRFILLDEPFEGLAPVIVRDLVNACRALAAEGQTIVLVEQNLAATLALAQRVYIINNGHIVHEGPALEIKKQPELLQRYLGV